ncbi:MAG: hypothetical protein C5B51_30750 [Terriglobia bacterium]|nr:MAG: hypothetical protein C5B51_30750 [Terriglobia bacterium]
MLLEGALAAAAVPLAGNAQTAPAENPAPPLALALARLLNRIQFGDLPPVPVKHAKMILASTLASAAPGFSIGSARIIRDLAKEQGGRAEATLWFDGGRLPVAPAARANAMCSDAAASDDSDLRNIAHTGTALTAISLALAERTGASGPDVLGSIVTGYEAAGRIGDALGDDRRGFHASVIVAFGGVVAAAKLLKLTDEQMAHAISMTGTTMGGLIIGTNSWAREYHAGNAVQCAVNAAQAAARGFTVNPDLLEARGGFLEVFAAKPDPRRLTREMGNEWQIARYLAIKLVPGAHANSPSMEAAVNAARQANVSPDEVSQILVSGPQSGAVAAGRRPPKDMIEAIHSLPYFVASAVADKDFSWVHVTPEKIHSPVVAKLIERVSADPAPPAVHYEWGWGSTVTIVTKSGARFTSTVDAPRGSGPRGIEWTDVDAKYRALMPESHLPVRRIDEVLTMIHDFEKVKSASELPRLLHA